MHPLRDTVTGVRAVIDVGRPNYKRPCDEAADALRALVALPADRPGAWEAGYVEALDGQLHEVLSVLEGGDR